jgi:hypothetical protein
MKIPVKISYRNIILRILFFFSFLTTFRASLAQTPSSIPDSITVAVAPEYDSVGKAHRFWLGESYRKLWAAPVKMKVFHIEKEKGGFTILQAGGGLQTKSLRLKDAQGRQWVLRSIQKYPERELPEHLKKTIVKDLLQDQIVTGHPYAALTVPPLAEALGIPHSHPEVVYVPDDPALGIFQKEFAHSVLLLEEREPTDTLRTVNTENVQGKLEGDNDVQIDQKILLRARLLDLLLGDWDRHEDQWRWERRKEDKDIVYTSIPRDRDKVYYNTTGVLPWLLSHQWLKSNLQGFHGDIRDIEGYNFNNRYFDRYFLNALSEEDWREQIEYVQQKITDSLIRSSVQLLPDTIYALSGEWIINTMKERRKTLKKDALQYYRFLARYVDIPGSDKHEAFDIHHRSDKSIEVTIYKIKKEGTRIKAIYHRTFSPHDTREIRLYGLGGNDVFSVTGSKRSPIKVRMIGGNDRDSFYVDRELDNKRKVLIYDRSDQENILPSSGAKVRTSKDSMVNKFLKHTFKYDYLGPAFLVLYNLDQGLQFRVGLIDEKHGFRKEPYASKQELYGYYSTGRKSFMFTYSADIKKIFGNTDLQINIISRAPKYVSNFFGIGNETVFRKSDGKQINYYRNRYDYVNGDIRFKWNLNELFSISTGIAGQYYGSTAANNQNRFLGEYNISHPEEKVFSQRYYAGLVAGFTWSTRKHSLLPRSGIYWNVETSAMKQLNNEQNTFGLVQSVFDFYLPVFTDTNFVIANRLGGGTTFGSPAFFQQMQLGGIQTLRGYHTNRFTGKSMFYHNIEFRWKLFNFTSYLLPGTVGMIVFNDVGRVWTPGESSKKWHDGYGGGFYFIPAHLVLIQAIIGHSREGTLPFISFGFNF